MEDAEVDALQLLQHVAERRGLRGVDDQLRAGDVLDAAVDRREGVGQGMEAGHQPITRPPGGQHPRQLARAHDAGRPRPRARAGSIDIGLPKAFSTTGPQTGQERTGSPQPHGPALQQASLPQEPDLAGREDSRRRAQDRVDERGPAAAEAGDEQHPWSVVAAAPPPGPGGPDVIEGSTDAPAENDGPTVPHPAVEGIRLGRRGVPGVRGPHPLGERVGARPLLVRRRLQRLRDGLGELVDVAGREQPGAGAGRTDDLEVGRDVAGHDRAAVARRLQQGQGQALEQ